MRQLLVPLLAMALGLGLGRLTGGFAFSSIVCFLAAIFLVTPSLFAFERSDLRFALHELRPIGLNIVLNFGVLAAGAFAIGFATGDIGITAALILLALLPGGGMVMAWIRSSGADVRLGFLLSVVNLALVLPVTLFFGVLPELLAGLFPAPDRAGIGAGSGVEIPPLAPFMVLVVLPFALSRWLKAEQPRVVAFVERHRLLIGQATMAAIVFYLFSLDTAQLLFAVPLADLALAAGATLAFYGLALGLAFAFTPRDAEGRAVFWHTATRYVTLALILAAFSIEEFGATFILPIMMAYVVQFALSGRISARMRASAAAERAAAA